MPSDNPAVRLVSSPEDAPATAPAVATPPTAAPAPLLVGADVAGPMCGRSEASWWRDHAAGRIPAPVRLGGRTLWRAAELAAWVEAGCPCRRMWEALRATQRNGRSC
jgi:predicted DNA-binding transcriptional regulator AlpA